jgi:hypothetical protein
MRGLRKGWSFALGLLPMDALAQADEDVRLNQVPGHAGPYEPQPREAFQGSAPGRGPEDIDRTVANLDATLGSILDVIQARREAA